MLQTLRQLTAHDVIMATTMRVSWLAEHSEQRAAYASSVVQDLEHPGLAKHVRLEHARLAGYCASP